jgi:ATP-binding cassette subfamily F protein 3
MLQLSGAGKRFGHKLLFQNADWLINPDERTALVGANGTGKTTLLRVLAGRDSLDYGQLHRAKAMTMGYLPQDGLELSPRIVIEECLSVFADVHSMERELESLAAQMGELDPSGPDYAIVCDRFSDLDSQLHARDAYSLESQAGIVLGGLGFSAADQRRSTQEFSGGWQMRIALAKLLLQKPSLLLLDEPTNHLDLESRNWLEDYLKSYPHAYILISHDRYFLDVTVNKTVEIWNKALHVYSGNYEKYLREKTERRALLESAYKNQRDRIEQLESFISRFRAQATKARQVQSRVKELEKIERIEVPPDEPAISFTFPQPPASGRTVLTARDLSKNYGDLHVFGDANFTIERGDRIALVGPNGAGKSTLIRLLAQLDSPSAGSVTLGHNVLSDYFAQDQYKELDPNAKMFDDLSRAAPRVPTTELRTLLGCFLFRDDDVFKHLGVLSGGERNRYALARLLVSPSNFLLLDEPTNHLDMRAKDVLLEALRTFTGTCVFVSHDRYFLDGVATRVFEVLDHRVTVYPGNYEDYLWRKSGGPARTASSLAASIASPATSGASSELASPALAASALAAKESATAAVTNGARRLNPLKRRQLEERLAALEAEVPQAEAALAETEQALAVYVSAEQTQRLTSVLDDLRAHQAALLAEWEEVSIALDEASSASTAATTPADVPADVPTDTIVITGP